MRISKLSGALFGLLIITWIIGAFTMNQIYKERDALLLQQHEFYKQQDDIRVEQLKQSEAERMALAAERDRLLLAVKADLLKIEELSKKPKKTYVDKSDAELAKLMEDAARGH